MIAVGTSQDGRSVQGIYLVLWFGCDETVAGRRGHGIGSASALQAKVEASVPPDLRGRVSVVVLDVSRERVH